MTSTRLVNKGPVFGRTIYLSLSDIDLWTLDHDNCHFRNIVLKYIL